MIPLQPAFSCSEAFKLKPESIKESQERLTSAVIIKPESVLLFVEGSTGTRANLYIYTHVRQPICYCIYSTSKEHYRVKQSRGMLKRGPSVITL